MTERDTDESFLVGKTSAEEIASRLKIEEICSAFEDDWTKESIQLIEELARGEDPNHRSELVIELVATDFERRQLRDSQLTLEEYVSDLPEFSSSIQDSIQIWIAAHSSSEETDPSSETELNAPAQIGDYRIIKLIGRGGNGAVYEAVQESLNRRVAIKVLNYPHVTSHLARFQQEARAVAMLHHTNIVEVHGSGVDNGVPYFTMQLVEGCGLDQLIQSSNSSNHVDDDSSGNPVLGDRGQRNVAKIGLQVARALGHAHQQGVLHRDIKPSNLLIDQKGDAWVSDFGLAKLRNEDSQNTLDGSVIGTMRYVPPEAFSGSWTERADIYSLGVTLYELLALQPAFSGEEYPQLIKQITQDDRRVKPLSQVSQFISKDLETIVSKSMSSDPKQRFHSADEMADELERYLDDLPIKSRPTPVSEKLWRWAKRKPAAAALTLLVTAVAFIGLPIATWLWLQASSALDVAEVERANANQKNVESEESRRNAEAARYSSGILLVANHIDNGRVLDAKRLLDELKPIASPNNSSGETWEWKYLNQKLDTSRLTLSGDENLGVWQVAIRPGDLQIATVHAADAQMLPIDGEVVLWNAVTGQKEHVLREQGSRFYGCAYSHDGKRLATIGLCKSSTGGDSTNERGTVCLWDTDTGEQLKKVKLTGQFDNTLLHGCGTPVLPCIQFSDDDQHVITSPQPIEVRDSNSLELKWSCDGRFAIVVPDQRMLAYTGTALVKYELKTGKRIGGVGKQWHNFAFFSFSNGKQKLACKAQDRLRLWDDVKSIKRYQDISLPGIYWSGLFPDGNQFAFGSRKGEIRIQWLDQSEPKVPRLMLGHQSTVTAGAFSKDGKWLITGSKDGTAKIWDLEQPNRTLDTKLRHDRVSAFSFANHGTEIVYCGRNNTLQEPRNVGKFELAEDFSGVSAESHSTVDSTFCAHWPRGDFSFTRDGTLMVAPTKESEVPKERIQNAKGGEIGIWNCLDWKRLQTVDTQLSEISATQWSADNRFLAVGGLKDEQHKIRIFDIEGDTVTSAGEILLTDKLFSIAFWGNEKLAAATESEILIWDLSSNANVKGHCTFGNPLRIPVEGQISSMDFSPDGSRLALSDFTNDILEVYDCVSGSLCCQRPGPRQFCSVRYSPCGRRLALSGYDGIISLRDSVYGYPVLTLVAGLSSPGTFSINSKVRFSSDGQQIATNTWRGKIAFWSIAGREKVKGH